MVSQGHYTDDKTNELSLDDPRYVWLQAIASQFFARNNIISPPEVIVKHRIDANSSGAARFQGPISINAAALETLYQNRLHGSEHSLEFLLGHEYHHVISDKSAAEIGKTSPLTSSFLPALLGCLATGLAWFNLPGKYRLPGLIGSAATALFIGDIFNRNRHGRFEEARADLRGLRMALHGIETKEAQLSALDSIETRKIFNFESNAVSNTICFLGGYPSTKTRNQQLQFIRDKVKHTNQPQDIESYIEGMDQNIIKMSQNPLRMTINY